MSKVKMNVVVRKSSLPIKEGETINTFTQKLCDDVSEYMKLKLNTQYPSAWPTEIMSDKVVISAYDSDDVHKYYICKYSRNDSGFEFGDLVEVEMVESYVPVSEIKKATEEKGMWVGIL